MSETRTVEIEDLYLIKDALTEAKANALEAKPWLRHVDINRAILSIYNEDVQSYIVDGYLVVYDVGRTWCMNEPIVQELFCTKLFPGGKLSSALDYLRSVATHFSAVAITGGSAMHARDETMSRVYRALGYTKESDSFIQELT